MKGLLGKAEAVLEMTQESVTELRAAATQIGSSARAIREAERTVDTLNDVTAELVQIVNRSRQSDWLTSTQLAHELSVDPATIRQWYRAGRIRGYRSTGAGHIRFDRHEVEYDLKEWGRQ